MNQFYVYHCTYPNGRKYVGSKTVAPEQSPDYCGSNKSMLSEQKSEASRTIDWVDSIAIGHQKQP